MLSILIIGSNYYGMCNTESYLATYYTHISELCTCHLPLSIKVLLMEDDGGGGGGGCDQLEDDGGGGGFCRLSFVIDGDWAGKSIVVGWWWWWWSGGGCSWNENNTDLQKRSILFHFNHAKFMQISNGDVWIICYTHKQCPSNGWIKEFIITL